MENDLKEKLEKFMNAKIPIHIVLKKKHDSALPRFLNGLIISKKTDDIFIVEERKIGKTYVFVDDIFDVSVFTKDNKTLAEEVKRDLGYVALGDGVSKDEINLINDIKEE